MDTEIFLAHFDIGIEIPDQAWAEAHWALIQNSKPFPKLSPAYFGEARN